MSPAISESLVLASASKARARILAAAGISVTVDAAAIDERETKAAFRREGSDAAACAADQHISEIQTGRGELYRVRHRAHNQISQR